jgi:hypothetical protein
LTAHIAAEDFRSALVAAQSLKALAISLNFDLFAEEIASLELALELEHHNQILVLHQQAKELYDTLTGVITQHVNSVRSA